MPGGREGRAEPEERCRVGGGGGGRRRGGSGAHGARRRPWAAEGKRGDVPAPGERRGAAAVAAPGEVGAGRGGKALRGAGPREDVDGSGAGGGGAGSEAGQQRRGGAERRSGRAAGPLPRPPPPRPSPVWNIPAGREREGLGGEGKEGRGILTMAAGGRQASPPQLNPPSPGLALCVFGAAAPGAGAAAASGCAARPSLRHCLALARNGAHGASEGARAALTLGCGRGGGWTEPPTSGHSPRRAPPARGAGL